MSSEAHAEDLRGGRDRLDSVEPVEAHNEEENRSIGITDGAIHGGGGGVVQSDLENTSGDDAGNELKYESEGTKVEEDIALPPFSSNTTLRSEQSSKRSAGADLPSRDSPRSLPSSSVTPYESIPRLGNAPAAPIFDRRLQPRISSISSAEWNISSTVSPTHSRRASLASQTSLPSGETSEEGVGLARYRPWEVVRWSKLKKLSNQAFSESAKRAFGRPTFLTIGAYIAVGTSRGITLLFDYQQSLKNVIGQATPAAESGPILALAISADHSTIAAGHANGSIFTWDLSQPSKPFLHIPPLSKPQLANRKSDGHVIDRAVLHIGFLGHRHTALVSADESGMAFSHLASRGLGSLGRNVKTTRILGRYPDLRKPERPTSVLAFSPLPLGNLTQTTDNMGITAILTPFLLVIVSTTPVAQTHFKLQRAKDVPSHSALTGCLAWFPAVKLRDTSLGEAQASSNTKLVYCWSNNLSLLEVEAIDSVEPYESGKIPDLSFKPLGLWRNDEAILAVQWMSRSIIAVLTITQRLVILTDNPLRIADSSDLNSKHIYHQDIFSRQLLPVVDKVGGVDNSVQGVIPDAYYMSFKAYKGRLFLLGTNDISLGTLSNWADRLMSLMEAGNPISAIELATSYYNGETDKVTIGLPRDDSKRHSLVKDKVLELLSGSLRYIFNDDEHRKVENEMRSSLQELARVSFAACLSIGEVSFLFDEAYDWFSDSSVQDIFFYELEHHIIQRNIDRVPTMIIQDILVWYSSHNLGERLERILCTLQTDTMDIDDVSTTCMRLKLYDALISVWNRAFNDYVTPLMQIMSIVQNLRDDTELDPLEPRQQIDFALKLFLYITLTLTGRRYPDGRDISPDESFTPKASVYGFIFADRSIPHPQPFRNLTLQLPDSISERNYPYLRCLLGFDSYRFLSMLHEVFEDSFLNGDQQVVGEDNRDNSPDQSFGMSINRQRVVNILLEVISPPDFGFEETVYLDIFLARNLPKYAQFILLSGSSLRQILIELCSNSREDLNEECQLSVEYLLSTYQPPDLLDLVPLFSKAKFFRILKSTYRSSKLFAKWLEAHFEDPEGKMGVFTCIGDCLRPNSGLSKKQSQDVKAVIAEHIKELAEIDVFRTANTLQVYAPQMLDMALDCLGEGSRTQFIFLQAILEPPSQDQGGDVSLVEAFCDVRRDAYVRLMCKYNTQHVADYVGLLGSTDLHLDAVLPAMEESGIVDAAVIVLTRNGLTLDAMRRLLKHLDTLQADLLRLINFGGNPPDTTQNETKMAHFLADVQKYIKVGVWLCQHASSRIDLSSQPSRHFTHPAQGNMESNITVTELLWLDLIDGIVRMSQAVSSAAEARSTTASGKNGMVEFANQTTGPLVQAVQHAFTGLLAITSRNPTAKPRPKSLVTGPSFSNQAHPVRFLPVLTAFMSRLASRASSISSVRSVLNTVFSAYLFESSMLALANALLEKDVFERVIEAEKNRRVGWRPRSQLCEGCKRRAWGTSAGGAAWEAWQRRETIHERIPRQLRDRPSGNDGEPARRQEDWDKGKGRDSIYKEKSVVDDETRSAGDAVSDGRDGLIVFSCTHIFHQACLEGALEGSQERMPGTRIRCPLCD